MDRGSPYGPLKRVRTLKESLSRATSWIPALHFATQVVGAHRGIGSVRKIRDLTCGPRADINRTQE
jgi:hypothetical protein